MHTDDQVPDVVSPRVLANERRADFYRLLDQSSVGVDAQRRLREDPQGEADRVLAEYNALDAAGVFDDLKDAVPVEVEPVDIPAPSRRGGDQTRWLVPKGWYSRKQAVDLTGLSRRTLERWHKEGIAVPHGYMWMGQQRMWLYDDANIKKIIERRTRS